MVRYAGYGNTKHVARAESTLTLSGVRLVITGSLRSDSIDDVQWALIARGAFVMKSLSSATGALIVGDSPNPRMVAKARELGKPVLTEEELRALLDGVSLPAVLAGARKETALIQRSDLRGLGFLLVGRIPHASRDAIANEMERHGARLFEQASRKTSVVVVGEAPGEELLNAHALGMARIEADEFAALLGGKPLSEFVAARLSRVPDPRRLSRVPSRSYYPKSLHWAAGIRRWIR